METMPLRFYMLRQSVSLNRTMQYGNAFEREKKKEFQTRLNRTMQYGNQRCDIYCFYDLNRLNRTMQYGNEFQKQMAQIP